MYEHIGGVLCNITQHQLGRQLLVEGDLAGVRAAVEMISARSTVRRAGAAAAVKNLVMSAKADGWLEQLLSSRDMLEKLLVRSVACGCRTWAHVLVLSGPFRPAVTRWQLRPRLLIPIAQKLAVWGDYGAMTLITGTDLSTRGCYFRSLSTGNLPRRPRTP